MNKKENLQPIDNLLKDLEKLSLVPVSDTKSYERESADLDTIFYSDQIKISQKSKQFTLSCQSSSSFINQQEQELITSENNGILPVGLKTDFLNCNFTPGFDDKYYFPSQKKQQKGFCHSPNKMTPLHDISTDISHNTLDESNDENLFSPVFQKLQCQYLLPKNNSETIVSKEKLFSCSSGGKIRNKQILNSFKVSSQSTPKTHKCLDNKDDKTQHDPEFHVSSPSTKNSNKSNENLCTDSFFLQATQADYEVDKDLKSFNIATNTLPEIFHDAETQKDSSLFSKNDSTQLTLNNLISHSTSRKYENFKDHSVDLGFVNAHQQENYDVTLSSSFNHSQNKQEPSILFINDTASSENDINSVSISNIVQCNYSSLPLNENEFKKDKIKDSFKITDSHDCNLLVDSQKLVYEDDKGLQDHCENHENFQDGNSALDKNGISFINISDCSNESFNEHKSLLGLSSISNNDSKLISRNLDDQDLLPYSSFENDPLVINAVENTLNNTALTSFEENDLGQFNLLTTFLNDSSENQNKL